jgi:biotin carboxyl carrier protein
MSKYAVTIEGRTYTVEFTPTFTHEGVFQVMVNGQATSVTVNNHEMQDIFIVGGRPYRVEFDRDLRWLKTPHGLHSVELRDLEAIVARPVVGDGRVKAPIPGLIAQIRVAVGDEVKIGQSLMILEAMKMQNELRASKSGVVTEILVNTGDTVSRGQVLAEIADAPSK